MDEDTEKPRGNYAPRGRRRQRITLDAEHAEQLHYLWLICRADAPDITKTDIVQSLITQTLNHRMKPDQIPHILRAMRGQPPD